MISITTVIQIQIQADSVVSDTNGFINFWLQSLVTRGERQFLKSYANNIMLTPPHSAPRVAHLVVFKMSAGRDRENSTSCLKGRRLNYPCFQNGRGHKTAPSDYASGLRDPSSSKPYKAK